MTPSFALVLGGGGSAGNAWLIGVIAGLHDAGVDVTAADLIVGTSAGATAAAQVTGARPADLYAATVVPPPVPPAAGHPPAPNRAHTDRAGDLIAASADPADMRRRLGAAALAREAAAEPSFPAQWRATVASRLPVPHWPEQRMLITALDAETGEGVVFDRDSGVDLVDAVAASCSSAVAYRIGARRYIDGGYRSNAENADLAAGHADVLVLAPFGGRTLTPPEWRLGLAAQVDDLRAGGARVETLVPDGEAAAIFAAGGNVMDPSARPIAARAGFAQGRVSAPTIGPLIG